MYAGKVKKNVMALNRIDVDFFHFITCDTIDVMKIIFKSEIEKRRSDVLVDTWNATQFTYEIISLSPNQIGRSIIESGLQNKKKKLSAIAIVSSTHFLYLYQFVLCRSSVWTFFGFCSVWTADFLIFL